MTQYEWIEELSEYMKKNYMLSVTRYKGGSLNVNFVNKRGSWIGYSNSGHRDYDTSGLEGEQFKQTTYDYLNWVLAEEKKGGYI